MLREITSIAQLIHEPKRRWFEDDYSDLIVWHVHQDEIISFELYYDKRAHQRAVRWEQADRYAHYRVDDGEERSGKSKASPVLIVEEDFDCTKVAFLFESEGKRIDADIANFVNHKIMDYPVSAGNPEDETDEDWL